MESHHNYSFYWSDFDVFMASRGHRKWSSKLAFKLIHLADYHFINWFSWILTNNFGEFPQFNSMKVKCVIDANVVNNRVHGKTDGIEIRRETPFLVRTIYRLTYEHNINIKKFDNFEQIDYPASKKSKINL